MANQASSSIETEGWMFEHTESSAIEDSSWDAANYEEARLSALEPSSSDAASYEEARLSELEVAWWDAATYEGARVGEAEVTPRASNDLVALENATVAEVALRHSLVVPKCPWRDALGRVAVHGECTSSLQPTESESGEWGEEDWAKIARVGRIPPLPSDLEPHMAHGELSQGAASGARCPSSDRTLTQMRGQRPLLASMFVTLAAVGGLFHAVVVRPESARQERLIAQLHQASVEQRSAFDQERVRLESRISQLDERFSSVRAQLDATRTVTALTAPIVEEPSRTIAPELRRAQRPRAIEHATTLPQSGEAAPASDLSRSGQPAVSRVTQQAPVSHDAPLSPAADEAMQAPVPDHMHSASTKGDAPQLHDAKDPAVSPAGENPRPVPTPIDAPKASDAADEVKQAPAVKDSPTPTLREAMRAATAAQPTEQQNPR